MPFSRLSNLNRKTVALPPIPIGKTTLIPQSTIYWLPIPGTSGGILWSRPSYVALYRSDGYLTLLPIYDYTRYLHMFSFVIGVILSFVFPRLLRRLYVKP